MDLVEFMTQIQVWLGNEDQAPLPKPTTPETVKIQAEMNSAWKRQLLEFAKAFPIPPFLNKEESDSMLMVINLGNIGQAAGIETIKERLLMVNESLARRHNLK